MWEFILLFSFFLNIFFKGGLNAKAMKNCLEMRKKEMLIVFKLPFVLLIYSTSRAEGDLDQRIPLQGFVSLSEPLDCLYRMVDEAIQLSPDHI